MVKNDIKTIVFDLGGVYFTKGSYLAIEKIANLYNIKSIAKVREILEDRPGTEAYLLRLGLITMDEFEEIVIKKFKIKEQDKFHIRNIWFSSYIPNYKMEDVVKQLKKRYRLVIFSGNVRERVEYLDKRYHFLQYFDDTVFSFECQKDKNDIDFYEELINHINCEPSQAILIDDEMKNIIRAKTIGLNGILYYYTEHFVEELKKFGIELDI